MSLLTHLDWLDDAREAMLSLTERWAAINSGSEVHPEGALVKSGAAVYWILGGQRRIFSGEVFASFGFSAARVVSANAADLGLPAGEDIKLRDGTLVKQGSDYYVISDGRKLKFSSSDQMSALGYKAGGAVLADIGGYEQGSLF